MDQSQALGEIIGTALIVFLFWAAFDNLENNSENLKSIPRKLRGFFISSSSYEVVEVKNITSHFYGDRYSLVISENGVRIPVDCSRKIATKIEEILALNHRGTKLLIKAKVDRKRLHLISLKGYMVKQ